MLIISRKRKRLTRQDSRSKLSTEPTNRSRLEDALGAPLALSLSVGQYRSGEYTRPVRVWFAGSIQRPALINNVYKSLTWSRQFLPAHLQSQMDRVSLPKER